jgi:hypothetical protein
MAKAKPALGFLGLGRMGRKHEPALAYRRLYARILQTRWRTSGFYLYARPVDPDIPAAYAHSERARMGL